MIAQIVLSFMLGCIIAYAWAQYSKAPIIGLLAMLAALAGLYFSRRYRPRRGPHPLCLGDHQPIGHAQPSSEIAFADGADGDADAGTCPRQCAPSGPVSHHDMIQAAPAA
jgi:hypothetical protein